MPTRIAYRIPRGFFVPFFPSKYEPFFNEIPKMVRCQFNARFSDNNNNNNNLSFFFS